MAELTDAQWAAEVADVVADLIAGTISEEQAAARLATATESWPTRTLSNADLAQRVSRFMARLNGLLLTNGPPPSTMGDLNTFAYDTANGALYGPKTASGWGTPVSLVGPTGKSAKQIVIAAGLLPAGATDAQFATWLANSQKAAVQPLLDDAKTVRDQVVAAKTDVEADALAAAANAQTTSEDRAATAADAQATGADRLAVEAAAQAATEAAQATAADRQATGADAQATDADRQAAQSAAASADADAQATAADRAATAADAQATGADRLAVAEAVSVEAMAREQLIRPGENDFTFQDALGFVAAVLGAGALDLIDWRIEASNEALTIRDQLGFVALSVTASDGIRVMGASVQQDAAALAVAWPAVSHIRTGLIPRPLLGLARWRKAMGGTLQGLGNARVLCIGDSNTMGWSVITGGHRRALAYPAVLAKLLGGVSADGFGRALTGTTGYATYDPRLSIGAGWSASGATSLGGEMWLNATDASALVFSPSGAWDAAEAWMVGDGQATVKIGVAGSLASYTPPAGTITRLTWTGALAVQGLRIERVSGEVKIIGWSCYRANAEVVVYNAGRSGWSSGQYADNAQVQSPRNAIASVGADLCLVQVGLNDRAQGVAPALFRANLDAIVTACAPANVALIVSFEPGGSSTYPWSAYVAEILDCARVRGGLPVVDMARRLGDRAAVVAGGWNSDDYHPYAAGIAETARAVHQTITL